MDALTAGTAIGVGALAGLATGLVPGLHVNTLIPLAALVATGPAAALALVAVGTVHGFVAMVPAVYLGAPGEDTAVATLPAHRMLARGQGPQAIHVSVQASLVALLAAVALLLPYRWVLDEPLRLLPHLERAIPWLVGAALAALILQERRHGWRRMMLAGFVLCLSGALGFVARGWSVSAIVSVPASPLLPLLSGLFAVPGLLVALAAGAPLPLQDAMARPLDRPARVAGPALLGTGASLVTAVLPGFTAAVATALCRSGARGDDPRSAVAMLSAVNTAHPALAVAALWIVGRGRSGLAIAVQDAMSIEPWDGPPAGLQWVVAAMLLAGAVGAVGTLLIDRRLASHVHRVPGRALNGCALGLVFAIVATLSGGWGIAMLASATAVGLVPLAYGLRRVHLVGCLLIPVLA